MRFKRIITLVLAAAVLGTGCNAKALEKETIEVSNDVPAVDIEDTAVTTEETVQLVPFEFNPHVYSPTIAREIPQDHWDALYNLCDALREGEDTFECATPEAFMWCTDASVLCNLFPAAGAKVEALSGDVSYDNGIGKIQYNMPVDEFLVRQAQFEVLIEDILNSTIESDDTDYEKALKLYLYVADNYTYSEDHVLDDDNFVYSVFVTKKGMCVNFASLYAYLLLQAGIDAFSVSCFEETICHSWTYAVISGKGYYIDTTWALKSSYDGVDRIYLDYFLMSAEDRNNDGCPVGDLTVQLLPEFWINRTSLTLEATDDHYNIRDYCSFVSLDEESKILTYCDIYNELHEFCYEM